MEKREKKWKGGKRGEKKERVGGRR